jgi:hypothetical protein
MWVLRGRVKGLREDRREEIVGEMEEGWERGIILDHFPVKCSS